ncbi:hypothetical protein V0R50_16270 [Pseudomonas sp. 148P]|uniref:Uncharacterized protein n=1 Tax=Pseudomonas ulcerans TaxID=3115852 RepID=A0ABU7HTJ2_9PSED|nr:MULTISPECIES: hypothetical protein [unclassified Pseudomonas]MEE1923338.1 hypothetical protein [Pseudomonas sp. 147P]MEE1934786.1 hypothetical protein [Pseudomonas sp. 148P]
MIVIIYEAAAAEIPAAAGKPKVPAVAGWTGRSPEGPNLDSKISQDEHTRIINEAIAVITAAVYPAGTFTGNTPKQRLGEFKNACDDANVNHTLKITKGLHQRHDAHITAQLSSNAFTYHLNVMASNVAGALDANAPFHWKIVSVSAKAGTTEELPVVADRAGLFHPLMRRNSITLAAYQEQLRLAAEAKAEAERQAALRLANAAKQAKADALIKKICTTMGCQKAFIKDFQATLLKGDEVPFTMNNKARSKLFCKYNAAADNITIRQENGATRTIAA